MTANLSNRSFEFDREDIVVGSCIRSLVYAALHGKPIVFHNLSEPFRFDDTQIEGIEKLGFKKEEPLVDIWGKLFFLLSLAGLVLPIGKANKLRVVDNTIFVSDDYTSYKYNFKKLIIFEDQGISGLPRMEREESGINIVYDWVNVRSGCYHEHDFLQDEDSEFVKEIIFYPSDRNKNNKTKDLVAISTMTSAQLEDFDYSSTMVKFKVLKMMKAAGIRGARNGRDQNNPERYKYYAVKVEPAEREVVSTNVRYYKEDERFDFCYDTVEQILESNNPPEGYLHKLLRIL